MPFLSDTASAIKSRFGFHDRSVSESVPFTPDLLKSVSRDHHLASTQSVGAMSAVRRISDWDEEDHGGATGSVMSVPRHAQSFEFSEDPSFWKDHNVQVIIRLRPLSNSEISVQGQSKCVKQESCQTITWTGHPESRFTFDIVADETVSQEKMFKVAGLPMVDNCMGGYNSCMFAYGQTGSGKTHTMLGDIEGGTRRHSVNCGMTPRVFEYLFSRIQKEKEARKEEKIKFTCKCSFLEIYNEQILDLLDPSPSTNLQIREDVKKGVYVENLKEIEVASARDVLQQLIQGAANRKVAATNMNRASSRSHSVFTCIIESKWESQGVTHHRFARLNLVDLAGSERQKSSGAEGERLKEATNINKSLSTLGLVIMNLVSMSNGKSLHVPYRDSRLTFLLQDSLGGNSKTIIIANISPSLCCSLETLSTLKFAQRAKFIRNNAIINEDASGDVIAMRMQIQQLKKEVSQLRTLVNGGTENLDNDTSSLSFLGSPGFFKWEGLHGSSSPLMSEKRTQKKDYEVALVGAFRREKDKEIALKALTAENQAAMQLAKQREDEIKSLKMILRFREAGVKRLEAVAAGKISAETHLLKEKEEHLKEIEVLRTQVDRNQEVMRFATENLHLKEEIRRLKAFCEEGEREMMNEQIIVLQNKLLEALDWKLMNESDSSTVQQTSSGMEAELQDDLPTSSQEQPRSPSQSSINEGNEFLRIQVIQNQAEIDSLHKQLEFCFEEKERLERHVNDLMMKLEEEERSFRATEERTKQLELTLSTDASVVNDQMELKTMVDAIAAASQREAEAHEKAFTLYTENNELQLKLETLIEANEELQSKLKALIEEKNSLIEMYERAASKSNYNNVTDAESEQSGMEVHDDDNSAERGQNGVEVHENDSPSELANVSDIEMKTVENLEQLHMELHEEKELANVSDIEMKTVENLEQQHMELREENEKLMGLYEIAMHERDEMRRRLSSYEQNRLESIGELHCPEKLVEVGEKCLQSRASPIYPGANVSMEETCVPPLNVEQAFIEFDEVLTEIKATEEGLQLKQEEFRSLELLSVEMQEKRAVADKKLLAMRYLVSNFSSSIAYFEQREARAKARLNTSTSYLRQKKEELARLQDCKEEAETTLGKIRQSEIGLKNNLAVLKSKLEEENKRQESEKVLFAIDNIEKVDTSQRNWQLGGKATELLKSEEEKTKLQYEIQLSREKLGLIKRESEDLRKRSGKIESEIQVVEMDIQKGSKSEEEMKLALEAVIHEMETLLEIKENGMSEIQSMILEYQQRVFDADLKRAEMKTLEEELQLEFSRIEELRKVQAATSEKMTQLLKNASSHSCFAGKMEEKLQFVS